ncbi:hypothetical protein [Herbaspirillum sp. SJZ107]|uniref:hypothetical protein n=1 Tax=Herbaspirillum sp. SJZ107 TaxID=2572881 RepID=UPI0011526B5C|nr:hypothetical protein [Herbaspirillum sp. SJZ107]
MRALPLLAGLLLSAATATHAAEPVTVLGLPLGGKLKMPIRQCSFKEVGTDARSMCWVDAPTTYQGTKSGIVIVPGSDKRPLWAAHATFRIDVSRDGTLESFSAHTAQASSFVEILNSITGRFGQSTRESRPGSRIHSAQWNSKGMHIELICSDDMGCNSVFVSAAVVTATERAVSARKAIEAARPAAP